MFLCWLIAATPAHEEAHVNNAIALVNHFLVGIDLPIYEEPYIAPPPMLSSPFYSNAEMEKEARIVHQYETVTLRYRKLREYSETLTHPDPSFRAFLENELFPPLDLRIKICGYLAAPSKLYFLSYEIVNIVACYGNLMVHFLCKPLFTFQYIEGKYHEKEMIPEHIALLNEYAIVPRIDHTAAAPGPLRFIHVARQRTSQCEQKLLSLIDALHIVLRDHPYLPSEEIKNKFVEAYQQTHGRIPPELESTHNVTQLLENVKQLIYGKKRDMEEFIDYAQTHLLT